MFDPLRRVARTTLKSLFHKLGADIVRLKNNPQETLVGLRHRPIRTVIDCGANQGQFGRYISRLFPEAALYCFEPLNEPYAALSAWAATQKGRVRCFNVALGDREGEAVMHHHLEHSPSSSLLAATDHEVALFPQTARQSEVVVSVTTLDTVLADFMDGMAQDILLKLDVQGYEDRVLRGATRLLGKVQACLLEVSVDPLYRGQASFKDLLMLLDASGLEYAGNLDQAYGEDGRVMWLDALFVRCRSAQN
ncbi:MAG TPA: FkbM family methyltransferase [Methylococcus sp.]|nr:FkbM family methyltransferase [Methylococcus sp.]